jgi:hypothetical protein
MAYRMITSIRGNLDRAGMTLSALCVVHCLATLVLVSALGIGGSLFENPLIHEIGLAAAMVIAAVAIGLGALRHRRPAPFVTAMTGLTFMGGALAVPHGVNEAVLTILGVALVSVGHILNLRANSLPGARRTLSGADASSAHRHR